jgi:hypothetical protein
MQIQNYSNHSRFVTGYHGITFLGALLLLIGSIVNLVKSSHDNLYSASLIDLTSILLILIAYYARAFALRAQDRAICSEEKFRYYLLTKEVLPKELTVRQIVGLRFASDDEMATLVARAIKEKMSENDIKKSIKNWRGDHYRA